jgi:hypothetical protein
MVLTMGSTSYNVGVGSDSYSDKLFFASASGSLSGNGVEIFNWLRGADQLLGLGAEASMEDNSTD